MTDVHELMDNSERENQTSSRAQNDRVDAERGSLALHNESTLSTLSTPATTGTNSLSRSLDDSYSQIQKALVKQEPQFRVYRRRWIGLAELTMLNFAIGWGYSAPSVVSTTATEWYDVSYQTLNWLGISSQFVFLVPAPFTLWILNRYGPKFSIIIAAALAVLGNWLVYAAAATHNFPLNVVGSVISSMAAPFVLAAPARYSRQWFDDNSRTLAIALPSLAYPLGAGVGALSGPYMVKPVGPLEYSQQALIIAIIFTVAALPAPFIPRAPPTPPTVVAQFQKASIWSSLKSLASNPVFYLQFISFSIFAGAIDTITGVTNQAIVPYNFPQVDAGYAVATLIFAGVAAALILSPILDHTKAHRMTFKIIVILLAASYTAFPFMPQTGSEAGLYFVMGMVGACSLSVEPCVLEFQAAWTHPVSPEFSSVVTWSGAKAMSGLFIILVGNVLVSKDAQEGQPAGSLFNGLIFMAVMAWLCVPCAWVMGHGIFKRSEMSKVEGNDC